MIWTMLVYFLGIAVASGARSLGLRSPTVDYLFGFLFGIGAIALMLHRHGFM